MQFTLKGTSDVTLCFLRRRDGQLVGAAICSGKATSPLGISPYLGRFNEEIKVVVFLSLG